MKIRKAFELDAPKIIEEDNLFGKSKTETWRHGFFNLYTKEQINEILNNNYRLSEKMPRGKKELIINLPKSDGIYSVIVIRRALVNSTENKALYLYEYMERVD